MAVPVALVVLPLGLLFLLSGLIVNLVQATFFVTVRPFSKSMYRRINRVVAELLWIELVWLVDWWAGVKVELNADSKTFKLMASRLPWQCISSHEEVIKVPSSEYMNRTLVIGWSMWFTEYLFLERSWAKDENTLKCGLERLKDFPRPFWLALFVEGTRFTPEKLLAAQEYAASQDLPIPRNVLIPRTKGFVSAVKIMRPFVPAVYDVTVAIPSDQPSPTMHRILKGQPSVGRRSSNKAAVWRSIESDEKLVSLLDDWNRDLEILANGIVIAEFGYNLVRKDQFTNHVHVHVKRHQLADLPGTDEGVSQWCKGIFVAKDAFLDKYKSEDSFGVEQRKLGRPVKSLLVVVFWICLLSYAAFRFVRWTKLLSTWKGVALTATGLLLVTVIMHIFVRFSRSERSASSKS